MAEIKNLALALGRAAGCALLASVPAVAASGGRPQTLATSALTCASSRNPMLGAYTFELNVAMRMRHFPWLRFHMAGTGQYERGREYSVTFTQRPSFAKGFENVDLSAFDPSMWSRYYTVQYTGSQGGASSFVLRPLRDDAQQANPLRQALVSLDSQYATRSVELQYASGDIDLEVTPARIGPYRLPITSDVTINLPGHDLSAHAEFSNYALTPQTQHAGGVAMRNWNQCLTAPVVAGSLNQAPKL